MLDLESIIEAENRLRQETDYKVLRPRDVAQKLKIPEAALLEAHRLQNSVVPLGRPQSELGYGELLAEATLLGEVMALTRNEGCVLERYGRYTAPTFTGLIGSIVGEIDLRFFLDHWVYGYAVSHKLKKGGVRRNLQFFDKYGEAIHKIYVTRGTNISRLDEMIEKYVRTNTEMPQFSPKPATQDPKLEARKVNVADFLNCWGQLQHSHDFGSLIKTFGLSRIQAMQLAAGKFTYEANRKDAEVVLRSAARAEIPLMIFVGNEGCIQIYSGIIRRIVVVNEWLNVLDRRFNMHLRSDLISNAWVVTKPSIRGDIHSLELYDEHGECFVQIFGARKPGKFEREDWRNLVLSVLHQ